MNCAECGKELNPFGCLLVYIPDEDKSLDFCPGNCHEKYLLRYPKYSIRQMQKIATFFIEKFKKKKLVDWRDEIFIDSFFRFFDDKEKVEEILNGTCNAELSKSKKKETSTRQSRSTS